MNLFSYYDFGTPTLYTSKAPTHDLRNMSGCHFVWIEHHRYFQLWYVWIETSWFVEGLQFCRLNLENTQNSTSIEQYDCIYLIFQNEWKHQRWTWKWEDQRRDRLRRTQRLKKRCAAKASVTKGCPNPSWAPREKSPLLLLTVPRPNQTKYEQIRLLSWLHGYSRAAVILPLLGGDLGFIYS